MSTVNRTTSGDEYKRSLNSKQLIIFAPSIPVPLERTLEVLIKCVRVALGVPWQSRLWVLGGGGGSGVRPIKTHNQF